MADDINELIKVANESLHRCKITTVQRGGLYIRGNKFPPKPGDAPGKRYRIATGYAKTPRELKLAIALAKKIDGELALGQFEWANYLSGRDRQPETVGAWIQRLEQSYWSKRERTSNTENTWRKSYYQYLKGLPQHEPLTLELLESHMVTRYGAGKRSRQLCAVAFGLLADEAGLGRGKLWELGKGYKSAGVAANEIPSDEEIEKIILACPQPVVQWCAGVVATFGIRPHEVMRIDTSEIGQGYLRVEENSKTGGRLTVAVPPHWVERFGLEDVRQPQTNTNRSNNTIGSYISSRFKAYNLPTPYTLRDAWAVRAEVLQIASSAMIADYMGHDLAVHSAHYLDAIRDRHQREAYERYRERK